MDWTAGLQSWWIRGHYIYQPKQCTMREISQNYHTFALFDSPQMDNLMIPVDILILWIEDLVLYIAMPTSVMSSGSAATSTPKYMQNCDTYLEAPKKRFKKKTKKITPQKKEVWTIWNSYSGPFVFFERGVNFRCFSMPFWAKKQDT